MKIQLKKYTNKEKQLKLKKLLLLINSDKSLNTVKTNDKPRSLISHRVPRLKCWRKPKAFSQATRSDRSTCK